MTSSSLLQIARLDSSSAGFDTALSQLLSWHEQPDLAVEARVTEILADIRGRGDEALLDYTNRFDGHQAESMTQLTVEREQIVAALHAVPESLKTALEQAAERIRDYHEHQRQESWSYTDETGTRLGQKITPLDRVGLYVPGGKAAYPSSVLMASIPAKVAGVQEVVLVSPAPGGKIEPAVLAAAAVAGVDRIYTIGGAQAIGALAYGTESVPKVDKIVGPGNIYVATAKRQVFGLVDIDMIAGPSEILVISDGKGEPDWVAMDLFSQAEHDEQAQSILLCPDAEFIDAVYNSINRLITRMPRRDIITASLASRGALIKVGSLEEAMVLSNRIAPEHLELALDDPEPWLASIRHAGAIFMGHYTSESLGDYCAGPNHVLPTSGTARFSSPLGVYDYVKRSSLIYCSAKGAAQLGKIASTLARSESLEAHACSADYRIN